VTPPLDGGVDSSVPVDAGVQETASNDAAGCDGSVCNGTCVTTDNDPANCGRCSHSCGTGQCSSGVCQPTLIDGDPNGDGGTIITSLTTEQGDDNPQGPAQHIFWGETGTAGGVFQDNVLGGNMIKLSTSGVAASTNVVASGSSVFWFSLNLGGPPQPILEGQVSTANSQTAFSTVNGSAIQSIMFDATNAAVAGSLTVNGTQFAFFKCPVSTKTCTLYTFSGTLQGNVATDGTKIYVADSGDGIIDDMTLGAGSNESDIVQNQATPTLLRIDGTFIHWFDSGTKAIERQSLTGSTAKQLATTADAITGLAADPVNVYWTDPTAGVLSYAPITGSGPNTAYVSSLGPSSSPMRLVRDSAFLYFTHNAAIYRVALP